MALEQVPDLAAVAGEWCSLLGDEYAHVGRFLLPTPRIARSVKGAAPGRTCTHEIRQWKQQFLSVCPDGCDPAEVTRDEVTIHRLDVVTLAREVAEALGLEPVRAELVPGAANVWHIGDRAPYAGFRFPAYFTVTGEPEALSAAADGLAARGRPFILLSATRSALTQAAADVVRQARACFVPLDELLGDGSDGRLALLNGLTAEGVLAEFLAAHVPQPRSDDGMVFFPTPAGARWSDVSIRFIDGETVSVKVKDKSAILLYSQMGMIDGRSKKPTKQWRLLESFAKGHGRLDWSSSDADRRNQKRRETLARNLCKFFGIDEDPFVLDGNGWRASFAVEIAD